MKKHLEHCHSADWAKACKTENEGSKSTPDVKPDLLGAMDKFLQRKTCMSWRSGALTNAIVNLIASDLRPINFVNGAGFRQLMQVAEPGYTVPSKTHITTLLRKKYEDGVSRLNSILLRAQGLAFTMDLRTSKAIEHYMTVTAHHIDEEWKMVSLVLKTAAFPQHHTGKKHRPRTRSSRGVLADCQASICYHL